MRATPGVLVGPRPEAPAPHASPQGTPCPPDTVQNLRAGNPPSKDPVLSGPVQPHWQPCPLPWTPVSPQPCNTRAPCPTSPVRAGVPGRDPRRDVKVNRAAPQGPRGLGREDEHMHSAWEGRKRAASLRPCRPAGRRVCVSRLCIL